MQRTHPLPHGGTDFMGLPIALRANIQLRQYHNSVAEELYQLMRTNITYLKR